MTMWKCEGRCVVILVTFMVQTLFIISGGRRVKQISEPIPRGKRHAGTNHEI